MLELHDQVSQAVAGGLAQVITEQKEAYKTFERLADEIALANGLDHPPVDRRKLARLASVGVDPKRVLSTKMTIHELAALDVFLRGVGYGGLARALSPAPPVLKLAAERRRILFLMGAKPIQGAGFDPSDFVSRMDLHATNMLSRVIDGMRRGVRIELNDVHLADVTAKDYRKRRAELKEQEWYKLLMAEDGPSVICMGSPRACPAAEIMLARMFGAKSFRPIPLGSPREMPFSFIWADWECARLQSAFALPKTAAPGSRAWNCRSHARALRVKDEFLPSNDAAPTWNTYGVIAAQRRPGGQVWIVCAGLTGPGTYACAKLLESLYAYLPAKRGKPSEARWSVVTVEMRQPTPQERSTGVDERHIIKQGWHTPTGVGLVNVFRPPSD